MQTYHTGYGRWQDEEGEDHLDLRRGEARKVTREADEEATSKEGGYATSGRTRGDTARAITQTDSPGGRGGGTITTHAPTR